MGVDHLDIILCHDIEFVDMPQIVEETLPALRKIQQQGKVRFVGVSGYPMKIFRYVLDRTDLDVILSYNHYTLQNTMLADLVPYLKGKGVGIMNAAPFSARLLTNAPLPPWHKATPEVRAVCRQAAEHCAAAAWTSPSWRCNSRWPTPTWRPASSARPTRRTSASGSQWAEQPIDQQLLGEVLADPEADPQLVLHRRPAREQRPAADDVRARHESPLPGSRRSS